MTTAEYEVVLDAGNFKVAAFADGRLVVIRNAAALYKDNNQRVRGLSLTGGPTRDNYDTTSIRVGFRDADWLVGEKGYDLGLITQEVTSYARYGSEEWYATVAGAFASLYKRSGTILLTIMVPVHLIRLGEDEIIKGYLNGRWEIYLPDEDRTLVFEVKVVAVVPEGFGSLFYHCVSEDGKTFTNRKLAEGRIGVTDFGGFNTGISTYDALDIGAFAESYENGLLKARRKIGQDLKAYLGRTDIGPKLLDEIIRTRKYRGSGDDEIDVADIVVPPLLAVGKHALDVWDNDLDRGVDLDGMIIAGGGRITLGEVVGERMKQDHRNIILADPNKTHLTNGLGILRWVKFMKFIGQFARS